MRAVSGILLAFFLVAAGNGTSTRELVENLKVPRLRGAAYQELMKRKDPKAVYPLQGILPELDATGQLYGVNILAATKTKAALTSLKTLTQLGDPHLRVTAGAALYRLGDKSARLAMADALLTPNVPPSTLRVMIIRLYAVPEPVIQGAVARQLVADADHLLLYYAMYLLHRQGAAEFAPQAERVLGDRRPALRAFAAAFLLRFGYEEHVDHTATAIREGKLDKTWWARTYGYLVVAPRIPDRILEAIADRVLAETDRTVRLQMISLLGREAFRAGAKALRKCVGDGDRSVAGAAFDALTKIPGGMSREYLSERLEDPEPAIRLKAVDALRRHDDASGLRVAVAILKAGSPVDRAAAAKVVAGFPKSEAVGPLIAALADERAEVRSAALTGLGAVLTTLYPYRRFNLPLTGYDPGIEPAKSQAAIEKIRRWWDENRTGDW